MRHFLSRGDPTGNGLNITGIIDGGAGDDTFLLFPFRLSDAVRDIAFAAGDATMGDIHLQNIETITLGRGTVRNITGSAGNETFVISGNLGGLNITGIIDGGASFDTFTLANGGRVRDIAFTAGEADMGDVHLQNIELIQLIRGTVRNITGSAAQKTIFQISGNLTSSALNITGILDGESARKDYNTLMLASGGVVRDIAFTAGDAAAGDVHLQNINLIELLGGTVRNITGSNIIGSAGNEVFRIVGDLTSDDLNITGIIDGGAGDNTFRLFSGGVVRDIAFTAGEADMGDVHLQNIGNIDLRGGTVRNITGATIAISGNLTSSALNITGIIDSNRILRLATGGVVRDIAFTAGEADMGDVHLQSIRHIELHAGTVRNITGSEEDERFYIVGSLTNNALNITGIIDGGMGVDTFALNQNRGSDAVRDIAFSDTAPASGNVHLQNIELIQLTRGTVRNITGSAENETFFITGDPTGNGLNITGIIDGGAGDDTFLLFPFRLSDAVRDIAFAAGDATMGDIHLQNIETITLGRGTVRNITGSAGNETFVISGNLGGLNITGIIDGGASFDTFTLADGGRVRDIAFTAGEADMGDVHLQNIELIQLIRGTVRNITGSAAQKTIFQISGNLTSSALNITGILDGESARKDYNTLMLASGGVVRDIAFTAGDAAAGDVHLQNINLIELLGGTVRNITGSNIIGSAGNEVFRIVGDLTSDDLNITGIIDGGAGDNTFRLFSGGVVRDIAFTAGEADMGDVHLQNIGNIDLRGGTVRNITGATIAISGNLTSSALNITGIIDSNRILRLATGGVVRDIAFTAGEADMGDVHLQSIRHIELHAGTVRNITGSEEDERFYIVGSLTNNALNITGIIDGGMGVDTFALNQNRGSDAVRDIAFSDTAPASGNVHLQNIELIQLTRGTVRNITGSAENETFFITGDPTGNGLNITGIIDGGAGDDTFLLFPFRLSDAVRDIAFAAGDATMGDIHLQNIETITLGRGTVRNITGSAGNETFVISGNLGGLNITGIIDGGASFDTFTLADGGRVRDIAFTAGEADMGDVHLQNIELIQLIRGTVRNITGSAAQKTIFQISGNLTSSALNITGIIDGGAGDDTFMLTSGGRVRDVAFTAGNAAAGDVHLQNIERITINGGTVNGNIDISGATVGVTFNLMEGVIGPMDVVRRCNDCFAITGSGRSDVFIIAGDTTGDSPALDINGLIQGRDGQQDEVRVVAGGVVNSIRFNPFFVAGNLRVADVETITIDGGRVTGSVNASRANEGITFNLMSGSIGGDVTGSPMADSFVIGAGITIGGIIDGGVGTGDEVQLNSGAVVNRIVFSSGTPASGQVNFQNIETITLNGGTVNGNIDISGATVGVTFNLMEGVIGPMDVVRRCNDCFAITGSGRSDVFIIAGDTTGDSPALDINGLIQGRDGQQDEVRVVAGGVVNSIRFNPFFVAGNLRVADVETITIDGGRVTGSVNASRANEGITFNLMSGSIGGDVTGSPMADSFVIGAGITIGGIIDGGVGTGDEVQLNNGAVVDCLCFRDRASTNGDVNVQNIEIITLSGGTAGFVGAYSAPTSVTFNLTSGTVDRNVVGGSRADIFNLRRGTIKGNVIGSGGADTFIIAGDLTTSALNINRYIDGGGISHTDELRLISGGRVTSIISSTYIPSSGWVHIANIETITIDGGTVNGSINLSSGSLGRTFNLRRGTIDGNVIGGPSHDTFNLHPAIRINGYLDGGGGTDTLRYVGASSGTNFLSARNGLARDNNLRDSSGSVRRIEDKRPLTASSSLGADGLSGLSVRGFKALGLSPALNLYGAMSDALMQFGQQTAAGFGLADLDLATGRATSLVSKDSPFSKGKIWAHKITHSGNGKGSIGLNLTGLTARADSDYDYEMSLTQHGFDAPLMTSKIGAFNLRAVSHAMTGTIKTNVAEANVTGYGAGVALLWQSHNLSAHLTSLASTYEVEAHTSPLNPQAVVSEVSEGSFSAMNAVVSAGIADKRKITYGLSLRTTADLSWQTLSLDDFNETGADGIAVNFDKATRFTARVGAALETEHWFSDVVFVHETSSGGTLSSGLSQNYKQDDGTAFEMKFGGKVADLATGLTLKAHIGLRASLINAASLDPSARFDLSWRF